MNNQIPATHLDVLIAKQQLRITELKDQAEAFDTGDYEDIQEYNNINENIGEIEKFITDLENLKPVTLDDYDSETLAKWLPVDDENYIDGLQIIKSNTRETIWLSKNGLTLFRRSYYWGAGVSGVKATTCNWYLDDESVDRCNAIDFACLYNTKRLASVHLSDIKRIKI